MAFARVEIVQPIAGTDDVAALRFEVETTPRHSIGSVIRPSAARRLILELQSALDEIAANEIRDRLADSSEED